MSLKNLGELVGKRITDVVVKNGCDSPKHQVFLVFDDGSAYEFYSMDSGIHGTMGDRAEGLARVLAYMPSHTVSQRYPDRRNAQSERT